MNSQADAVAALLAEAQQAHGVYEATELNGVYDREWPRWYAGYAVDHGIGDLLGRDVDAERLADLLAASYAEFERIEPAPAESWSDHLGRRIADEL
jgi:uridylate kinase